MSGNLASLLEDAAATHPDRDAVIFGDAALSYAEVDRRARQVAGYLRAQGIGAGDKVALSCPNIPAFPILYYGILKAGAVVVPFNILFKRREVAYHLEDSQARLFFCFEGTPELSIGEEGSAGFAEVPGCETLVIVTADPQAATPVPGAQTLGQALDGLADDAGTTQVDEDDTAVILYTSGTTGRPKGAELRHRNMRENALLGAELFGAGAGSPDTLLSVLPLFHSFGQTVIQNGGFAYGGTIVLLPRFEAEAALSLMRRHRVSFFAGVPTMYWGLLRAATDEDAEALRGRLRIAASGGSPLPVEVHSAFRERFGTVILEGYGLSETSPIASFTRLGMDVRPGSVGVPVPGVEMKLIDPLGDPAGGGEESTPSVGEIAIRGHNVMKGYYRRPEATAEALQDGWFRSGDLARMDEDGYYFIVDRAKDLIIRGGYNVYPREVEELLMEHPAVSLVAVVGVPDEALGQEVKAFVVPETGAAPAPEELIAWTRERLAAYKYPRRIDIVDALPMTSTGKILKRELS